MEKLVVSATSTIGAALLAGALVQVYYSGLPPASAWSAPALYSFLGSFVYRVVVIRVALILKKTASIYRIGAGDDDYTVLDGDRVIGRIFLSRLTTRSQLDVDDLCQGFPVLDSQSRLFRDTPASDGGLQSAVANNMDA